MQPLAPEQLRLGKEQGSIVQRSLRFLCSLCCWLLWEMGEMNPCSKSPLLLFSAYDQQVSPFCGAVCVPLAHLQCQVQGWPHKAPNLQRSDPKESMSQNSWRCAACRNSFLRQSDELIAAALLSASEVWGKGWLAPRGLSCEKQPRSLRSG